MNAAKLFSIPPFKTALTVFTICFAGVAIARADAPPNDNFANAQVIVGNSFSVAGTEIGATPEGFEEASSFPDSSDGLSVSVWYSWTPTLSGALHVSSTFGGSGVSGDPCAIFVFTGPDMPSGATFLQGTSPGESAVPSPHVTAYQPYFFFVSNGPPGAHSFILQGSIDPDAVQPPPPVVTPSVSVIVKTPVAVRSTGVFGKVLIQLSSAPTQALSIGYKTGGPAVAGVDYKALAGSVTIPAGTSQAAVKIKPLAGSSGNTSVRLSVIAGDGYTLGAPVKGKVRIED